MTGTIDRLLFGKDDAGVQKRVYFWNLCSSLIYALQSAVLLLIVTRIGGLNEAGFFSILYVTTQMFASLGSYSMRNFQVSDAKDEYSFKTYYSSRLLTCLLMLLCCGGYWLLFQRGARSLAVIACLSIYRTTDGLEDVYHAEIQKKGRLDAASIGRCLRIAVSVTLFAVSYALTRNLVTASAVLAGVSHLIYVLCNVSFMRRYPYLKTSVSFDKVLPLLVTCFPTCASALLYNYLANAPKYAIEANLDAESQAIFNIIFMPIFVINVLSMFIYNPMVASMGVSWQEKRIAQLKKQIFTLCVMILGITVFVAVCGYLFGYWMLGLVYGVDLAQWRGLLTVLLLFGGISALDAFLVVVLTIIREQKFVLYGYIAALVFCLLFMNRIVIRYQLFGAGCLYGLLMSVVLIVFSIVVIRKLFKRNAPESDN